MQAVKICGSLADKLFSRGFGKRDKRCIYLSPEEALYLAEKGTIKEEFSILIEKAASIENFDIRYLVYRDLRDRGYVLTVVNEHFEGRKNYSMSFYPLSDMDFFEPSKFMEKRMPLILSIVDGDGDITYYMVDLYEPKGNFNQLPERKLAAKPYGKRYFLFEDMEDAEKSTYGKNEGVFGHLSIFEAQYLGEKGIIDVKERSGNENEYLIYRDLRERGLIVKSGFKYGTLFRAYENSMEEHSKYLVHLIHEKEELQKISRAVRVAHGVRKILLLAYIKNEKVRYFKFSWVKP